MLYPPSFKKEPRVPTHLLIFFSPLLYRFLLAFPFVQARKQSQKNKTNAPGIMNAMLNSPHRNEVKNTHNFHSIMSNEWRLTGVVIYKKEKRKLPRKWVIFQHLSYERGRGMEKCNP
jgi:hypothetical protein